MNSIKYYILLLSSIILFFSCEKVIDLEIEEDEPKLVIQGVLYKQGKFNDVSVRINHTVPVFGDIDPDSSYVTDAVVIVYGDSISTDKLVHIGKGIYVSFSSDIYTVNTTYKIKVFHNGNVYEAESYMPSPIQIDTVYSFTSPVFPAKQNTGVCIQLNPNTPEYFRIVPVSYGYAQNVNDYFIADDRFYLDHACIDLFRSNFISGDNLYMHVISTGQQSYEYHTSVQRQLNNDGGVFNSPPSGTIGNFTNGALGLFEAVAIEEKEYIIP